MCYYQLAAAVGKQGLQWQLKYTERLDFSAHSTGLTLVGGSGSYLGYAEVFGTISPTSQRAGDDIVSSSTDSIQWGK